MKRLVLGFLAVVVSVASYAHPCEGNAVPVEGFAQSFVLDSAISDATISVEVFEDASQNQTIKTDNQGHFSFCTLPGYHITLTLHRQSLNPLRNYYDTQTATVLVPPQGLTGEQHNMTFQTPRNSTFSLLKKIISYQRSIIMDDNACQVATTVRAFDKTLHDGVQGIEGAVITLNGIAAATDDKQQSTWLWNKPYYFSIMLSKTWPFSSKDVLTSKDGGVLLYNLPASDTLYTLGAEKEGVKFSSVKIHCKPGAFINAAPPQSPSELTNE